MRHVILNLHGVGTPQRPLEPGEDRYWITPQFFQDVLALSEEMQGQCISHYTADDGNLSDLRLVAPALAKLGRTATFFVLTGRLGQSGSLDATALRDLEAMGHKIGSHGHAHVPWILQDPAGLNVEIFEAKRVLSDVLGHGIDEAGLPFGRYDRKVLKALDKAGFSKVYSSDGGPAYFATLPIHRTSLRADMTLEDVHRLLRGQESVVKSVSRRVKTAIKKRL